jgi:hypothetical protein
MEYLNSHYNALWAIKRYHQLYKIITYSVPHGTLSEGLRYLNSKNKCQLPFLLNFLVKKLGLTVKPLSSYHGLLLNERSFIFSIKNSKRSILPFKL